MRVVSWFFGLVLLAQAPLGAAARRPRLGTFVGEGQELRHFASLRLPRIVTFRTRADRPGKVYIALSRTHEPEKGTWRQSFVVVADATANGVRTIRYVRPRNESRSGQYNLRA